MKSENTVKKQSAGYILQKFSAIVILLAIIVIMSIGSENFFSGKNFLNILNQSAVLGIMAMGMTFVIITGGIDLSVGSLMALSGSVMAVAATSLSVPPLLAVLFGIAVSTGMGFLNGFIITKGKIQPFVATLGMYTALEGVALLVTDGLPISGIPEQMLAVGSQSAGGVVPYSIFVFAAVAVIGWILLDRTVLGRNTIAVGGNEEASKTAGIKTDRTKITIYALSGLCCGIGGLVMTGRLNSANALMGDGMELQAITAAALGGTSLAGGVGSIGGTVIGVLTIGVLNNGLDLMNTTPFWQKVILGIMIVAVVLLDSWRKRKFND